LRESGYYPDSKKWLVRLPERRASAPSLKRSDQFGADLIQPPSIGLPFVNQKPGQVRTQLGGRLHELLKLQINHFFD
jgi:hypothetical protein